MKFKSEVQLEALNNATIDTDKFLVSNGGTIMFRTGAQLLADIGGSVGGITSLNTQTQSTQTLVVGNEGLDFDIVSNAGQHTFNLPDASSTARGVVTIGVQTFAGAKTFIEDLTVNNLTVGEGGAPGSFGICNTAIGIDALTVNTGNNNTAIGYIALANNIGGFQNTAIGANALYANIGTLNPAYPGDPVQYFGVYNTAVGYEALKLNNSNNNTAVGIRTLANNTTGFQNTAIGSEALLFNTTGEENTAIGKDALRSNVDANWNTAIGSSALQNNTLGFQNTTIGRFAMQLNISGSYNTSIGVDALTANLSSNYNTALGYKAGYTVTGLQNTFIGAQDDVVATFQLANVQNSTAIGYNAYTTKNNQVVIGNSIVNETLLRGDIKLTTPPTTSPASYDLLTINTFAGLNTGRIESVPSSSLNFLPLVGGNMTGNINWLAQSADGLNWTNDSDSASIKFYSTGDADPNTRLEFNITDNNTEYFRWTTTPASVLYELMRLAPTALGTGNAILTISGKVLANSFEKSGGNNNQILAAGGGIITAGTNITITGGTISSTGGTGTVTSVASGNGMNFTTITGSGSITLGTPSSTTLSSTNSLTTTSHTHAFAPGGTVSQYITGAGTLVTFPTIPTVGTWGGLNYPTWTTGTPFVKMTAAGTFSLDTTIYEPTLGNPTVNGYVLSSTTAGVRSWVAQSGGSTLSMGGISATANANGATITGSVLNLAAANPTNGGVVTSGNQTFSTGKKFTDSLQITTTTSSSSLGFDSNGTTTGTIVCNSSFYQFQAINSFGWVFKNSAGNVNPLTLEQSGNATFTGTVTATGFFNSSDARLKDIIEQDGDTIKFTWKDGQDNKIHIGYIAQEVQKKYPDQVSEDTNGMLTVNYIEVLVAKIQELENRIKQLEK